MLRQVLVLVLCTLMAGCMPNGEADELPDNSRIEAAMVAILQDIGNVSEVRISKLIGRRYLPSDDAWQVIACFTIASGAEQSQRCEDSFRLFELDNGAWIISVRIGEAYRWRELPGPESVVN